MDVDEVRVRPACESHCHVWERCAYRESVGDAELDLRHECMGIGRVRCDQIAGIIQLAPRQRSLVGNGDVAFSRRRRLGAGGGRKT